MSIYLIALLLYSVLLMALGLGIIRRVKSSSDFLVAGRSLGPGRIFATFLAANIGAGSTVGAAGLGYRFGMSAWWWVGSAGVGTFLLSQFLGPKLWRTANEHNLATLQDFLQFRYGKAVKAIIAVLLWLGSLAILSGQLIAMSWILSTVAGFPKATGCIIGGIVAIVYCTAGGLMSSSFVNMFELAVTMSGLLLAVPFALHALGGWSHMEATIAAQAATNGTMPLFSIVGVGARQIFAWIAILVPSFMVSPGLVQKLYGARDVRAVKVGVGLNALGQVLFAFVPPTLGLCALAALPNMANPELALPAAMKFLLPRWLGVLALASIFSAELSATDAILFMLSTSLTVDLYKTFLKPNVTENDLLRVGRWASAGAGIAGIAAAIALPSIIAAVSIFYGLIAVALFVPVLAALYWRSALKRAAIASIVCALAASVLATVLTHNRGIGMLSPQAVGILTAAVVMVLFSALQRKHPEKKLAMAKGSGAI